MCLQIQRPTNPILFVSRRSVARCNSVGLLQVHGRAEAQLAQGDHVPANAPATGLEEADRQVRPAGSVQQAQPLNRLIRAYGVRNSWQMKQRTKYTLFISNVFVLYKTVIWNILES